MKRSWIVPLVVLVMLGELLACGVAGWLVIGETLTTTGVDALFGQIYLTRDSAPVPARSYASNELLLRRLDPLETVEARLILLPGERYFWDPTYAGFVQTQLSDDEADELLAALTSGPGFTSPDTRQVLCVEWSGTNQAELAPCEAGAARREIHDETRMTASMAPGMAALQLSLADGRLAEYRLYSANDLLAYSTVEFNEPAIHGTISLAQDPIGALAVRAAVQPVDVLWPEDTAEVANARAARRLGWRYREGLRFLEGLESLQRTVGEVREIRPAEGENWSSDWMDGHSIQLLLWVLGDSGEGVVRLRGGECWEAEMMIEGRPIALTDGFVCPED